MTVNLTNLQSIIETLIGKVSNETTRHAAASEVAHAAAALASANEVLAKQFKLIENLPLDASVKDSILSVHVEDVKRAKQRHDTAVKTASAMLDADEVRANVVAVQTAVKNAIDRSGLKIGKSISETGKRGYNRGAPIGIGKAQWIKPGSYYVADAAGVTTKLDFTRDDVTITRGKAAAVVIKRDGQTLSWHCHYNNPGIMGALGKSSADGSGSVSSTKFAQSLYADVNRQTQSYPNGYDGLMYPADFAPAAKQVKAK